MKGNLKLPIHTAIIMDGNGRWASSKGQARKEGHKAGSKAVVKLMETAKNLGLKYISLYAFSTENWKRPVTEVNAIFRLLVDFIDDELPSIMQNDIRILHSGSAGKIPKQSIEKVKEAVEKTAKNKGMTVNFCLNYGSQAEILQAFDRIIQNRIQKKRPLEKKVSMKEMESNLYTHPLPPVDLMIRTAGEHRLSNFLLWQSAYAEIYFTETLWPDFNEESLLLALSWYDKRIRKFGGI